MSAEIPNFSIEDFTAFLLTGTLYQKFHSPLRLALPYRFEGFLPERIYFDCGVCDRNQAFISSDSRYLDTEPAALEAEIQENSIRLMVGNRIGGGEMVVNMINERAIGFYQLHYTCGICRETHLRWFLEIGRDERGMFIRKVGQEPPYDIGVSREASKLLPEADIQHYKHAKICISQSYGIGACIYLRRLIEDQINPLLENYLAKREGEGAEQTEIGQIRTIISERVMADKIRLVTTPHPKTGLNPVGRMYDQLSDAIHARNDDESTEVAKNVLNAFDEILVGLKRRMAEEAAYRERMQALGAKIE